MRFFASILNSFKFSFLAAFILLVAACSDSYHPFPDQTYSGTQSSQPANASASSDRARPALAAVGGQNRTSATTKKNAAQPSGTASSLIAPSLLQSQPDRSSSEVVNDVNTMIKNLKAKHPDVVGHILRTSRIRLPAVTLYEIVTPDAVIYTNQDVDYLLVGRLLLGQGKEVRDFTHRPALANFRAAEAQKRQDAGTPAQNNTPVEEAGGKVGLIDPDPVSHGAREVFEALPMNAGWTTVYGDPAIAAQPSRHVAVFEDPDCGYCQKLQNDLPAIGKEVGGLTVTVFPFVLEGRHPNGLAHASALICADHPKQAWKNWMAYAYGKTDMDKAWSAWSAKHISTPTCSRAKRLLTAWQGTGHELGFHATPVIMFASGATSFGILSAAQFQQMFDYLDAHPGLVAQKETMKTPLKMAPKAPVRHAPTTGDTTPSTDPLAYPMENPTRSAAPSREPATQPARKQAEHNTPSPGGRGD